MLSRVKPHELSGCSWEMKKNEHTLAPSGILKNIHLLTFLPVQMSSTRRHSIGSLSLSLHPGQGPYYRQLIEQILQAITTGQLQPGDRLPGSRALAQALGVSRSTLVHVYERLIAEGMLISRVKSGVFVADQPQPSVQIRPLAPAKPEAQPLAFDSGADSRMFPSRSWQKSMRASWQAPDPRVLDDAYATGYPPLKQAIAEYLHQLRGLNCSAEQVFITAGNRDALTLLRHAFGQISPDSRWLTETPSYTPIRHQLADWAGNNHQPFLLPVDGEGCRLPAQESAPPIVLLTPNRQYPSGVAMSSERRQHWLQQLQDRHIWLVEDDYDNEFSYQGRTGLPLMQADRSGRVFFLGSFSKVLFRGLRLGFILAPPEHCASLRRSRELLGGSAALPMQPVLTEFMTNGEFGRHINRMRRHYRKKRDYLLSLVEQYLTPWFDWQSPQGGMHLMIRLRPAVAERLRSGDRQEQRPLDQQIAATLAAEGVLLEPLSPHYGHPKQVIQTAGDPRTPSTEGFILGFSRPDEDSMHLMLQTLAEQLTRMSD